jgi:iron complex transport system substrate-binding protein
LVFLKQIIFHPQKPEKEFVENVGQNESLNVEKLIDLQPDVLIAFGITPQNPSIDLLQNNGQKVIYNGDWAEQSPLGKAEWIKLFGALYDKNQESEKIFQNIETEYYKAVELIKNTKNKPTILCGAIFQNIWYMPQGDSWAGNLMNEAKGNYLWKNTQGTGSLSLGFEEVFSKAQHADYWIDAAQFCSLDEMKESNIHYTEFKAFKNKKIYSSSLKKGAKGGIIFYEIAPTRPDLVLKDIIKIIHPECLPDYKLYFYQQLQ